MKILSIDTSSKICGVAILEKEDEIKVIKEVAQNNGLTHSETLMPIIKEILEECNLQLKDIDLIVCDKGPGSFTGIRIGVATAKAFKDSLGIKTVGISSLEALVYNVNEDGIVCSLIDAKNNSAYWSAFKNKEQIKEFSADDINKILEEISNYNEPITFVGDGAVSYKEAIQEKIENYKFVENNDLSAVSLGIAGINHLSEEQELLPLYIRKPQAEQMLEKKGNI